MVSLMRNGMLLLSRVPTVTNDTLGSFSILEKSNTRQWMERILEQGEH